MKKVVVISTSLRPGSNSHMMAEQFAAGAEAADRRLPGNAAEGAVPGPAACGAHYFPRPAGQLPGGSHGIPPGTG